MHVLVERYHPEELIETNSGLRKIEEHRIGDAWHHIGSLHILLSVLYLRETAGVKNWQDAEKWRFRKVSQIFENIFGTVVTGPIHGKHQTDFIETIKEDLIKSIKALWKQKREGLHPHRLDNKRNKLKFQKILEIYKKSVTLLSH
jgi:hypothetical protein